MPERVEWLGLSAVYSEEELLLMAELKLGGDRRELEVVHELKALCRARLVDWMDPQEDPGAPVSPVLDREPQNDERAPQRRLRRHEALDGQGSLL